MQQVTRDVRGRGLYICGGGIGVVYISIFVVCKIEYKTFSYFTDVL